MLLCAKNRRERVDPHLNDYYWDHGRYHVLKKHAGKVLSLQERTFQEATSQIKARRYERSPRTMSSETSTSTCGTISISSRARRRWGWRICSIDAPGRRFGAAVSLDGAGKSPGRIGDR
jgi:hypothetical protein